VWSVLSPSDSFEKETHALEQLSMRDLVSDGDARAIMDESITSQVSYIVVCELGLCDM
jgi:hypothetical protein